MKNSLIALVSTILITGVSFLINPNSEMGAIDIQILYFLIIVWLNQDIKDNT